MFKDISPVSGCVVLVEVHGATLAVVSSLLKTKELSAHLSWGASSGQSNAMATVGRDDAVSHGQNGVHAGGNGLLTVVQVAETTNNARLFVHSQQPHIPSTRPQFESCRLHHTIN